MMRKHARRLALMGQIPADPKYFKKHSAPATVRQKLERAGWVRSGGGFADPKGWTSVYHAYMLETVVNVPKASAIPRYTHSSCEPEYWMYGRLLRREYVYHYVADDRVEERGISHHKTADTLTFLHRELTWLSESSWQYD